METMRFVSIFVIIIFLKHVNPLLMKNFLLFSLLTIFSISAYSQDLFFSEYIEGSGNNKCVEIYNPTDQAIDLNEYYVVRFSNGSSVFTGGGVTHLVGTIDPYKTFVLVNGQTTSTETSPACSPELQAMADQLDGVYPAPTYMNGNDAIALIKTPNGEAPNADLSNVTSVDLIGQIGLGNAIESETGWSYVKDSLLTYNDSNGDPITGEVKNYIVQKYATDGSTYGPFWMSWTSNHSLIRKPEVITGVVANPNPFIVTQQWDTVPAQLDSTGYYSYVDIWDNLGSHACVADPNYTSVKELPAMGNLNVYPNPVVANYFVFESSAPIKSVQLYNVVGKEVINESYSSPVKTTEVSIGSLDDGFYLIKAIFIDNSSITKKILIK